MGWLIILLVRLQPEEVKLAQQVKGTIKPVTKTFRPEKARVVTDKDKKYSAFNALRIVSSPASSISFYIAQPPCQENVDQILFLFPHFEPVGPCPRSPGRIPHEEGQEGRRGSREGGQAEGQDCRGQGQEEGQVAVKIAKARQLFLGRSFLAIQLHTNNILQLQELLNFFSLICGRSGKVVSNKMEEKKKIASC
jgi:hypothetical protein